MALLQAPDEFDILSGDEFVILTGNDDVSSPPFKKHKRVHWSQDLVEIIYFVPTQSNPVLPPFSEYYGSPKFKRKKKQETANSLTRSAGQISTVMVMRGLQFITRQLNDLSVGSSLSDDRSRKWDDLLQLYMIRERLKDEKDDWV